MERFASFEDLAHHLEVSIHNAHEFESLFISSTRQVYERTQCLQCGSSMDFGKGWYERIFRFACKIEAALQQPGDSTIGLSQCVAKAAVRRFSPSECEICNLSNLRRLEKCVEALPV